MIIRSVVLLAAASLTLSAASAKSALPPGRSAPARSDVAPPDGACAGFGPGFHKLEGGETCVRVSGSVRLEMGVNTSGASLFRR